MPDIAFNPAANSSPVALMNSMNGIGNVSFSSASATQLVFANGAGTVQYIITGTGFSATSSGTLTGGLVTAIEEILFGVSQFTISGLNITALNLQQKVQADAFGVDNSAIEKLFLPLGYTYTGNASDDVLLSTSLSSDGASLNFSGSDTFNTGGGRDNIYLGGGNDVGHGGAGNDTFGGGVGFDSLYGDAGKDELNGQEDAVHLFGGSGKDRLDGGSGTDTLYGGADADRLTGGSGADVFLFKAGDGIDRITDLDVTLDKIDLPKGAPHSFSASGSDTLLTYGTHGDQVLLVGVDLTEAATITFI